MVARKPIATLSWALALIASTIPVGLAQSLPDLRILPLGDSITKGNGASDQTGYRRRLREKILSYETDGDNAVDMIGSLRSPSGMADNDHQGHSGEYLMDIRGHIGLSIEAQPNVVLVHAGTNNMDKERDLAAAPDLIRDIIDRLFEGSPEAVVLVAPVIWANDARMQANTDRFNEQLGAIIEEKQRTGEHILAVPIDIGPGDLSDIKHPNDSGYEKMAVAWFNAILDAHERGWIESPTSVNPSDLPGMGLGYGGDSGSGTGSGGNCGDGNWEDGVKIFDGFQVWKSVGTIRGPVEGGSRDKVILADLNNDGLVDYIIAYDGGNVQAWINMGEPNQWENIGTINPSWDKVSGDMVRMADVDDDGRADMIVLYPDGAAKVWKNVDNGREFESLDSNWATGIAEARKVYFEDMDGDGYADYVVVYDGGAVEWSRNTGNNGEDGDKRNWEPAEAIAPGPEGVPDHRTQVADIDGDGLSDYLVVYEGGAVKAWTNTGSVNDDGRNWVDLGTIAPGVSGVTGDMIRFADMDGDGHPDFLAVANDGSIRMWKNMGILGSQGSSLRFPDLDGDGKDDMVSVDAEGKVKAWLNRGVGDWKSIGEIAPGLDEDLTGAKVVFADVNGDELDDFIVIYSDGAVKAWLNNGNIPDKGKDRTWQTGIVISEGVGSPGRMIHLADLNGDGYADYLIVYDSGAVDCFLNKQNIPPEGDGRIWETRSRIATGVGEPGSKIRFADITGDGKDDYIVQYNGGSAKAYNNTGNIQFPGEEAGRPRNWGNMGTISGSVDLQGPVVYADIDGDGKDDYLVVFAGGGVHAYINKCDWKPPIPDDDDDDGGEDGLSASSSCQDVKDALGDSGPGVFPQSFWDETDTTAYWRYWLAYDADAPISVVASFANDWGFDNRNCVMEDGCNLPSECKGYSKEKGSGRAHLIMRSMSNLHEYFQKLQDAFDSTKDAFAILQGLFMDYYPEEDLEDKGLAVLFNLAGQAVGMAASMSGSDKVAVGADLFSVASDAIQGALENNEDEVENADEIASVGFQYLSDSAKSLNDMHDKLMTSGFYEGEGGKKVVLDTLFEKGAWLDPQRIPVLNQYQNEYNKISTNELGEWVFSFFHAAILNYAWTHTIVTIYGIPMTKSQFDEYFSSLEEDLKVYYDGHGYFMQSFSETKILGKWRYELREPPGWDGMLTSTIETRFTPVDVIKSSVDTHNRFGYGHEGSTWVDDMLSDPDWKAWNGMTPRQPGTFNIPVCHIKAGELNTPDPLEFIFELLDDPGEGDYGSYLNCLCKEYEDRHGERFWDQLRRNDGLDECVVS